MKTIEYIIGERHEAMQTLPKHKQIPDNFFLDWAIMGAREAQRWISIEEELPKENIPCIVKNEYENICICFMEMSIKENNKFSKPQWFNYFFRKTSRCKGKPITTKITHWRYVERQ